MGREVFVIDGFGGRRVIDGSIKVNGSKNDAVQAFAASLLFKSGYGVTDVPDIDDISKMGALLEKLGVGVLKNNKKWSFNTKNITSHVIDPEVACKIRASILLTGPLLARSVKVNFPHPGGCVIGERPIDLFLDGFKQMGAKVEENEVGYKITAPKGGLNGVTIFFRNQTVTGTETFMMAAVLARGTTVLKNCALEPEIENLGRYLVSQGARITGLGTPTITIKGRAGKPLEAKKPYKVLPDRIEAGSFLILGALAAKKLKVEGVRVQDLESLLAHFERIGVPFKLGQSSVTITAPTKPLQALEVKTHEYPGFPTDLQALMAVLLTQAEGESKVFEAIFEGRLVYLETLVRMGAKTQVMSQNRARITGPTPLTGASVESPDLRAGLAYILAAIVAKGQSEVHNIHYIDRGYECIDERLASLGVKIKRLT